MDSLTLGRPRTCGACKRVGTRDGKLVCHGVPPTATMVQALNPITNQPMTTVVSYSPMVEKDFPACVYYE